MRRDGRDCDAPRAESLGALQGFPKVIAPETPDLGRFCLFLHGSCCKDFRKSLYDETPPCHPANATGHRLALGWLRLARRAGECYDRGVKEQQPNNAEQFTQSEAEVDMYEGMVSASLKDTEAFRTTHAIRDQAGQNTPEKLETYQRDGDTKIDGVESRLTAKIDGVDTGVDRVRTEMKADMAVQRAEFTAALRGVERELTIFRWAFLFLLGPLSILAILGLAELIKRWFD